MKPSLTLELLFQCSSWQRPHSLLRRDWGAPRRVSEPSYGAGVPGPVALSPRNRKDRPHRLGTSVSTFSTSNRREFHNYFQLSLAAAPLQGQYRNYAVHVVADGGSGEQSDIFPLVILQPRRVSRRLLLFLSKAPFRNCGYIYCTFCL